MNMNMNMKGIAILTVLMSGMAVSPVCADAVVKIYDSEVEIFSNHAGEGTPATISRADVVVPAAVRSHKSPLGLIRVRFTFKDTDKKPVTGWVDYGSVSIDKDHPNIDVPGCPSVTTGVAQVTRGIRGLGKGC